MNKLLDSKSYKEFNKEIENCKNNGGQNASGCVEQTILKHIRKNPNMKDMVYPWINYDWSYDSFIDNKYNKEKTGATPKGNFPALFKNPLALLKLSKGFLLNSNPDSKSQAGKTDLIDCKGDKSCQILNDIRKSYLNQKPPYPDKFFNKKLSGENSSSYYIKTGTCLRNLSKEQCIKRGYNWVPNPLYDKTPAFLRPDSFKSGNCYQNKYAFIKNNSGFNLTIPKSKNKDANQAINLLNQNMKKFKGAIPSFINDLTSLSPDNIYKVSKNKKNPFFEPMDCKESFCNYKKLWSITNLDYYLIIIIVVFLMIIVFLSNS